MTNLDDRARSMEWRLPEQHFAGTPEQVAGDIDQLILMLVAYRHSLHPPTQLSRAPLVTPAPWRRMLAMLGLGLVVASLSVAAGAQLDPNAPMPACPPRASRVS